MSAQPGPQPRKAFLSISTHVRRLAAFVMTMAMMVLPGQASALETAGAWPDGGGRLLPAAIDGEPAADAATQEWPGVLKEHKTSLLAAGGVLGGITLFSAIILTFVVRRARRREESPPAGASRRGPVFAPAMRESKMLGAAPGSKAFPQKTNGPPARSGDTTRLTIEEELAAVGAEEPGSPIPPLRAYYGPGVWAVAAAWACLIAGVIVMVVFPGSLATCAPLFLVAVLLAVTAMTQRLVLHGSLVLATLYLAVPVVWLTQYLGSESGTNQLAPQPVEKTREPGPKPLPQEPQHDLAAEMRKALGQRETPSSPPRLVLPPSASSKNTAPPSVWRQIPAGNNTAGTPPVSPGQGPAPTDTAATPLPAMRVPGLPPLPAKAGGALFSYRARLSHADHLNPQGTDLRESPQTTFGDILLQERLHVHQSGRRDAEDTVDPEFAIRPLHEYRALFKGKEIRLPKNLLLFQLLKDDVIVDVQVFRDFLQVDVVAARE